MRRLIAVVPLVLMAGLAVTVLTTRAQQPAGSSPRSVGRKDLRSRIVALRAEVAQLQLRHDAARATLLELLGQNERLEFAVATGRVNAFGITRMHERILTGQTKGVDETERALAEALPLADEKAKAELENIAKGDSKEIKDDLKKAGDDIKRGLDTRLAAYSELAAELYGKVLELAEAEKQYNESR